MADKPFRAASNRKLTPDQVRAIRRQLAEGKRGKTEIGRLFGVDRNVIHAIAMGHNYRDVV